jgi:hypothetical protein
MSVRQRRQLHRVVDSVSRLVPELSPRIIEPAADKQKALGIADETLLVRVGTNRVITLSATEKGEWTIQEFDSITGDLVPVWSETADVDDSVIPTMVLAAAVGSLEEQLGWTGETEVHPDMRPILSNQLAVLRQRMSMSTGEIAIADSEAASLELEDSVG